VGESTPKSYTYPSIPVSATAHPPTNRCVYSTGSVHDFPFATPTAAPAGIKNRDILNFLISQVVGAGGGGGHRRRGDPPKLGRAKK